MTSSYDSVRLNLPLPFFQQCASFNPCVGFSIMPSVARSRDKRARDSLQVPRAVACRKVNRLLFQGHRTIDVQGNRTFDVRGLRTLSQVRLVQILGFYSDLSSSLLSQLTNQPDISPTAWLEPPMMPTQSTKFEVFTLSDISATNQPVKWWAGMRPWKAYVYEQVWRWLRPRGPWP